jgi:NADPH:quinone reductase-like Zn-dependent oxidoreductase
MTEQEHSMQQMKAVVTEGHGGYERLVDRDVPVPMPGPGHVLLRVLAAGVNNTDVNTRLGWYSEEVTSGTETAASTGLPTGPDPERQGWNGATPFPLIQGADCCGRVVQVASDAEANLMGTRVLVRPCMRRHGFDSWETVWLGSDFDGAFAQFVTVPAAEVFVVHCDWSDAELATIPCAYGTAENMLQRAALRAGEHVLVAGASGGVGSAAVQLARRKGARVTAIAGSAKMEQVRALGAGRVIDRDADWLALLGADSVDLVVDNVAGPFFGNMLRLLRRGGRYVSSGAIAGPLVELDMRQFYLKDLTLIGSTAWDAGVFPSVIAAIESGAIRPLVASTFPLESIADAQRAFLRKQHVGNFVLVPPP